MVAGSEYLKSTYVIGIHFPYSTGSPVIYLRQLNLILTKNKVNNWLNFQGPTQFCEIELEEWKHMTFMKNPVSFPTFYWQRDPEGLGHVLFQQRSGWWHFYRFFLLLKESQIQALEKTYCSFFCSPEALQNCFQSSFLLCPVKFQINQEMKYPPGPFVTLL